MPQVNEEQEQMWDTVQLLSNIDEEKAKTILKVTIEKSLQHLGMRSPVVLNTLQLSTPSNQHLLKLREIEQKMRYSYGNKEQEKAYEYLAEYIEELSEILGDDPMNARRKLFASLLSQKYRRSLKHPKFKGRDLHLKTQKAFSQQETSYYKTSEVAKKLGLSDQTIRRMCEKGHFTGAYQTDGGHWRIPKNLFITTLEQDERAEKVFQKIDSKNNEMGNVDEFDL